MERTHTQNILNFRNWNICVNGIYVYINNRLDIYSPTFFIFDL